jgi:hypothetical protein
MAVAVSFCEGRGDKGNDETGVTSASVTGPKEQVMTGQDHS